MREGGMQILCKPFNNFTPPPFLVLLSENFLSDAPIEQHQLLVDCNCGANLSTLNPFLNAGEKCGICLRGRGLFDHYCSLLSYQTAHVQCGVLSILQHDSVIT